MNRKRIAASRRLKVALDAIGETPEGLANAIGIAPQVVRAWITEGAAISRNEAELIAGKIHCSVDWLLVGLVSQPGSRLLRRLDLLSEDHRDRNSGTVCIPAAEFDRLRVLAAMFEGSSVVAATTSEAVV